MVENVVIIGAGAAGLTAAIYAARANLDPVVIAGPQPGGQLIITSEVENYPGFPDGVAGYTLGPLLQQQATALGLEMQLTEVSVVQRDGDLTVIQTDSGEFQTRALIVATGSNFSTLGIPGEEEFVGKGVSHCAACDGAFFMDQPVAVVGGGDAAIDEGIHLTQYASQVAIIHRRDALGACRLLQERAHANEKLSFCWNTRVRAIEGDTGVNRIQIEDVITGQPWSMDVAGVFLYIGLTATTQFLGDLVSLNEKGQIVTDLRMRTSMPGILAAGDVRGDSSRQLVSAAGDGATAALAAIRYIRTKEWIA